MPPLSLKLEHADRWREIMTGRDLIIIDSLRAATGGQDENDSAIRAGLDMLGKLSEDTGCRALVIHHARKQGSDDPGGRYAIRGSSAIFDAADSAYLFSAGKGEAVSVEHVKARTHGEPVEDSALVISDVEYEGDPKAGLRVQVHGAELVVEQRIASRQAAAEKQARADAESVRRVLSKTPGLGTAELRAAAGLSGARLPAALAHMGDAVDVREETNGRSRKLRHYLRGAT